MNILTAIVVFLIFLGIIAYSRRLRPSRNVDGAQRFVVAWPLKVLTWMLFAAFAFFAVEIATVLWLGGRRVDLIFPVAMAALSGTLFGALLHATERHVLLSDRKIQYVTLLRRREAHWADIREVDFTGGYVVLKLNDHSRIRVNTFFGGVPALMAELRLHLPASAFSAAAREYGHTQST